MDDDDKLFIEIPEAERIRPGDRVESIRKPDREMKVKVDGDMLVVRRQYTGKYWYEDKLSPAEFHRRYRKVTESPALRFLSFFEARCRIKGDYDQSRLWQETLHIAIEANMAFDREDFNTLSQRRRYLFNNELLYRQVVESGNRTALTALEHHRQRKPFLWEGKRLYEGARFVWEALNVKVTSFKCQADGSELVIACHQEHEIDGGHVVATHTRRVFKLSHADMVRAQSLVERVQKLISWLSEVAPLPKREFAHTRREEPNGRCLCEECAKREWGKLFAETVFADIDAVMATCPECGIGLYTKPSKETLMAALERLETNPAGGDVLHLWAVGSLPREMAIAERMLAVATKMLGEEF